MFLEKSFVVLCTVLVLSDAAFVDTITKCRKDDAECHKNLFQHVMNDASKVGIPEHGIPPFDPVELKDIHVPIANVADLYLDEGVVKGLRKCVVNQFETNIEQGRATLDMTCDLTLKGRYRASSCSAIVQSLFQAKCIHGNGTAKVKLEKLNVKINFNFFVDKVGEHTYLKEKSNPTYKFEVLGRVVFAIDNLYVGDEDASVRITNLLNENWRLVVGTVGNQFMTRAMEAIRGFLVKFFSNVPSSAYIIDDLTPYVKN